MTGLALALLVAIGIGVHNLGEGLAIGTSFAVGELQLGSFLVIGFMVHNLTEGLGIAAPAASERPSPWRASRAGADRGCARDARRLDRRLHVRATCSRRSSSRSQQGLLSTMVEVGRWIARRAPGGLRRAG